MSEVTERRRWYEKEQARRDLEDRAEQHRYVTAWQVANQKPRIEWGWYIRAVFVGAVIAGVTIWLLAQRFMQ